NPMAAMSAIPRDVGDPQRPSLQQLLQLLNEARHQFLEAKRRYFKLKQLVFLRQVVEPRRLQTLQELARLREIRQEGAPPQSNEHDPAAPSRPQPARQDRLQGEARETREAQELRDNVLRLQKLQELIRLRELLLRRQQRALRLRRQAAAAQVLPDQAM